MEKRLVLLTKPIARREITRLLYDERFLMISHTTRDIPFSVHVGIRFYGASKGSCSIELYVARGVLSRKRRRRRCRLCGPSAGETAVHFRNRGCTLRGRRRVSTCEYACSRCRKRIRPRYARIVARVSPCQSNAAPLCCKSSVIV